MLAYLLNAWLNRGTVEKNLSENRDINQDGDTQEFASDTEWMTPGRIADYVGKTYDWVQPRLKKYANLTEDRPDARNHLRKNYPGWVVDILKKEADKLSDYPVISHEDISRYGISRVIRREESWIDARLPYLGIVGETKLNPANNRLFEYFNKEATVPLLLAESVRMLMYPVATANESTVEGLAAILGVERKRVMRRLPYIDILPVVKMNPIVNQLYGYYPTEQTLEALANLGKRSLEKKPHHPSEIDHSDDSSVVEPIEVIETPLATDMNKSNDDTRKLDDFVIQTTPFVSAPRTALPIVAVDVNAENWTSYALCSEVNPELFNDLQNKTSVTMAKKVCSECVSRLFCLDYAVINKEPDGVWGGLTPSERKKLKTVS